jgi:FtsP/CotA-like multicopper oxidase with cupredoxin domain
MHTMRLALPSGYPLRGVITLWICAAAAATSASGREPQAADPARTLPERIVIADNRAPSGALSGRTLTVRLEARTGEWHPDRDTDPGVIVKAFALEGGALQIPGPLIRVTEGTEIRVSVRNRLEGDPLVVHGLYSRPGKQGGSGDVVIPSGETREIAFLAGRPGTYYYWGATDAATPLAQRSATDSQLSGALIVDPADGTPQPDRVLLIGLWGNAQPVTGAVRRIVINGRSWPHTERLTYQAGDSVRMRVINAGAAVHPMHLHGFYFNVDSRGDEREDTIFPPGSSSHMVVTERLIPTRTFTLTWKPTRPGNWLFHCHDNAHLLPGGSLDGREGRPPATSLASRHVENHALEMMAGPVMGITVTGASAEPAGATSGTRRHLRLTARVDEAGTDEEPAFGYTLDDGKSATPSNGPYLPGPTILLKRGEPVSITVANQLPESTAVHWHGIELESYYDGVAGFSGLGQRIAPAIEPGGSFEARFTPPRSGTFIYHTHIDEVRQQQAGLSGALLVVDSLETYDPEHDLVLLVTVPRKNANSDVVLLNGSSTPAPREMRAGEHYRLRFINVHTFRPSMRMRLLRESTLLTWRALAKDGMDLPGDQRTEATSEIQMGNGETYDFDFVPSGAGDIRLDVTNAGGVLLVSMPIRIR